MSRLIARLLLLIAVLAAPLGMTASPAAAAHHGSSAAMPMQHCPDQEPQDAGKGIPECAMACAAALPALAEPAVDAAIILAEAPAAPLAELFSSLPPETATPPPKTFRAFDLPSFELGRLES